MQPLPLRFREWGGWEDGYSALFLEVASRGGGGVWAGLRCPEAPGDAGLLPCTWRRPMIGGSPLARSPVTQVLLSWLGLRTPTCLRPNSLPAPGTPVTG